MAEPRIFIVGANGQLGTALRAQYPDAKFADIDELDITNEASVKAFDWSQIDVVLNAAAYTNVDGAETSDGRVAAWKVNAKAIEILTHAAWREDFTFVHISTDYVFDGTQNPHTEDEPFSPLSVYGASKAAGDLLVSQLEKHYILRTSWVIGEGKNFVRTMLELGKKGVSPTVVADQVGRLTFTNQLVQAIAHLLNNQAPFGTYNVSNEGSSASWAQITRKVFEYANYDLTVTDTTTAEYFEGKSGIAPRPLQSTLDLSKIKQAGFTPSNWQDDLKAYVSKEMAT